VTWTLVWGGKCSLQRSDVVSADGTVPCKTEGNRGGGPKVNPLFQRLCQTRSDVFILSSRPTCHQAGYVKWRSDAKWESGWRGGQPPIRQGSDPHLTSTPGFYLLQVLHRNVLCHQEKLGICLGLISGAPAWLLQPPLIRDKFLKAGGRRLNLPAVGRRLPGTGPSCAARFSRRLQSGVS